MHVNVEEIDGHYLAPGVIERTLLYSHQTGSGDLTVQHHTLPRGEITFLQEGVEYQHYVISGCALMKGRLLHGDTGVFVPGSSRFGEPHEHVIAHMGEGDMRILTVIYSIPHPNFRWSKTRIKNLGQVKGSFGGMYAQQLFTEEEHALMGSLRMHSLDIQTHAPGVVLSTHRNPEEFAYILRGNGEVTSGKDLVNVRPGSLVYTEEGVPHSVRNSSKVYPLQYVAFEFTRQDQSWTEMGHQKKRNYDYATN